MWTFICICRLYEKDRLCNFKKQFVLKFLGCSASSYWEKWLESELLKWKNGKWFWVFSSHRWKDLNNKLDYRKDGFRPLSSNTCFLLGAFHLWFTSHPTVRAFHFSVKVRFSERSHNATPSGAFLCKVFMLLDACSSCMLIPFNNRKQSDTGDQGQHWPMSVQWNGFSSGRGRVCCMFALLGCCWGGQEKDVSTQALYYLWATAYLLFHLFKVQSKACQASVLHQSLLIWGLWKGALIHHEQCDWQ